MTKYILILGMIAQMSFAIELPKPTGRHAVGTTTYHLVDTEREEWHATDSEHPYRELMVQVWYPALLKGGEQCALLVSPTLASHIKKKATSPEKQGWFYGAGYAASDVKTNSYAHASVDGDKSYPVIIFSHGFGIPRHVYSSILEELASHGYIVVAPNHTYNSDPTEFSDGRIIESATPSFSPENIERQGQMWIDDIRFILNELKRINAHDLHAILTNKMNLDCVGIMGHSYGGGTGLQVGQATDKVKAVVNLDGFALPVKGFNKPLLFMYTAGLSVTPTEPERVLPLIDSVENIIEGMKRGVKGLCQHSACEAYEVQFNKAHHMSFSDYFVMTPSFKAYEQEMVNLKHAKTLLVDFFNVYLKQEKPKVLSMSSVTADLTIVPYNVPLRSKL